MTTLTFYYAGVYLTDSCMGGKNVLAQLLQVTLHTCHRLHVYAKCSILTLHIREMPKIFLYSDSTDELKNLPTLCLSKRMCD